MCGKFKKAARNLSKGVGMLECEKDAQTSSVLASIKDCLASANDLQWTITKFSTPLAQG